MIRDDGLVVWLMRRIGLQVEVGVSRAVILTRRWAIKIPHPGRSLRMFLIGMIGNMDERLWSRFDERLCPVRYCAPGGLFLVMPRVQVVFREDSDLEREDVWLFFDEVPLVQDWNPENFGLLDGNLVCLDYATMWVDIDEVATWARQ